MPATTSLIQHKKSRSTKPKLFQCTGFGSCQMVFTRSEHLARHTRKHTGEKPFLCVVPGCTRRFSRFDNMMQHTQTHKTTRSKSPSSIISSSSSVTSISSSASTISSNTYEPENTPEFITQQQHSLHADSSDEEGPIISSPSPKPLLKELHLTQDEFEALQGFGRFKHTPIFIDSFRDLASVVYIEPNPVRFATDQS
ncbi:uncharacterized protein EV154DRAFT_545116 [Mucor mucedo]|uniref:uncharacterized protein n=1 Tax=Mucor mucedo TaxID=29922 RepID=UPI00222005A1|nr:uncharacterized protein EV154DRAFT_545116 [Mucor mucedo]KAI7888032.1 hypothetical protein EV154DRAFT_545116 [Mucor mucedo]